MPIPIKGTISGSSAASILGVSPYQTPVQAWLKLMEQLEPGFCEANGYEKQVFEGNASTRFGHVFEDSVIMLTEQATGVSVYDREGVYRYEDFVSCHIDGRFSDSHIYEGKTAFERGYRLSWGAPGTDRVPIQYQDQIQNNMMLTGAEHCTVGVLVFPKAPQDWEDMGWRVVDLGDEFMLEMVNPETHETKYFRRPDAWAKILADMGFYHVYHVDANPDTQAAMRESYQEWWSKHIIERKEPDPSDWEDIRRLFTAPVGTVVADDQLAAWLNEYKDIRKEIGDSGPLAKRKDQLKTLAMDRARKMNPVIDDDSQERMIIMSSDGHKLASFNGKIFR